MKRGKLLRKTPLKSASVLKRSGKLRPRAKAKTSEAFRVLRDGREICNSNKAGDAEYKRRTIAMWERQNGLCCNGGEYVPKEFATFDHEHGRGGGRRDDRLDLPDGSRINGMSCLLHNHIRGSKKTPFILQ